MEYPLTSLTAPMGDPRLGVLILILMEYPLTQCKGLRKFEDSVLILILMEYPLT